MNVQNLAKFFVLIVFYLMITSGKNFAGVDTDLDTNEPGAVLELPRLNVQNVGLFQALPIELVGLTLEQLEDKYDVSNASRVSRDFYELSKKRRAQILIKNLIGEIKLVKAGAFIDPDRKIQRIDQDYWLAENDVSQKQYDLAFDEEVAAKITKNLSGPNKPMTGLLYSQWDTYIEKLNKKLLVLWPIAYPLEPIPQAYRPEAKELLYAMTELSLVNQDGIYLLPEYLDTDRRDDPKKSRYLAIGKGLHDKPADVNDRQYPVNSRGFNLLLFSNVRKQTSTPFPGYPKVRLVIGCLWCDTPTRCTSQSIDYIVVDAPGRMVFPDPGIGLRLAFKFHDFH